MHLVFCLLLAAFFTPLVNSADVGAQPPLLSVSSDADSAAAAGTELGQLTKQAIPELERLWDSYLAALMAQAEFDIALGGRVAQLRATGIDDDTREEISAFAAELDLVARNRLGDGHLSMDELWTVQFLQDLMAFSKGWAFAIERGASGPGGHGSRLMVGRNLELDSAPVLAALHAIVRQRIGERVVVNPGFGGLLGVLNGFNDEGLVAALISAPGAGDDGASSRDRSAIAFALRRTLGRCARAECAVRLLRTHRFYGSHGILLADRNGARVLELAADQSGRVRRAADPTRPEMRLGQPTGAGRGCLPRRCQADGNLREPLGPLSMAATAPTLGDRRWRRARTSIPAAVRPLERALCPLQRLHGAIIAVRPWLRRPFPLRQRAGRGQLRRHRCCTATPARRAPGNPAMAPLGPGCLGSYSPASYSPQGRSAGIAEQAAGIDTMPESLPKSVSRPHIHPAVNSSIERNE
jgi:hypothetical protein